MKLEANLTQLNRAFNTNRPKGQPLMVLTTGDLYYAVLPEAASKLVALPEYVDKKAKRKRRPMTDVDQIEGMLNKRAKYVFRMPTPRSIAFMKQDVLYPMTRTLSEHGYKLLR